MTDDARLDTAISLVYDTVLDRSAWQPALGALAEAFGATAATRSRFDFSCAEVTEHHVHGFESSATQRYQAHYHALDPAIVPVIRAAVGRWHAGSQLFDRSAPAQQEYAVDFALPSGIGWEAGCKVEATSPVACLWFGVYRRPDDRPFGAPAERTFARLLPHLQRVARMERQVATFSRGHALAQASLDAFGAAVFIVDAARRLHLHNLAADRLLAGRGQLESRSHRLACSSTADDDRLSRAVTAACARTPAGATLRLASGHGPQTLHVMVVPLPQRHTLAAVCPEPLALVIAADPQTAHLNRDAYKGLLGLTDAETALLHALVHGRSVEEWATERGVSRNTVRTQLYSVFAKTGVDSQARLVGLARTLPAAPTGGAWR